MRLYNVTLVTVSIVNILNKYPISVKENTFLNQLTYTMLLLPSPKIALGLQTALTSLEASIQRF